MSNRRHYAKPPITEAVLDIRVELPGDVTLSTLAEIHPEREEDYPHRRPQSVLTSEISVGTEVETSASQTEVGFIFESSSRRQFFQVRLNGFTFNRLAPYDRWESFRDEARQLWDIYRSLARPVSITRIALRYINRLELPGPVVDFTQYLRTYPEVSSDLPQGLTSYFMQLHIPQQDIGAMLVLNQAFLPERHTQVIPVILDNDLFVEVKLAPDDPQLWDLFEQLRIRKNEVFEACITDDTRRLLA